MLSKRGNKNQSLRAGPLRHFCDQVAGPTGLEPATSNVTGWRSNQLNYDPAMAILDFGFAISD